MRALVLTGDGINCERETALACEQAGFQTALIHINDFLVTNGKLLNNTQLFILPGGFSFGDELGSGKILALKLKHGLSDGFQQYLSKGGLLLGICNGFQVLVRLEIFGSGIVLAQNSSGHFQNQWVRLKISGQSVFTDPFLQQNIENLELPIRHGEGRLVFKPELSREAKAEHYKDGKATKYDEKKSMALFSNRQCPLQYTEDINGSWNQVAALSAYEGRVLGLMPHPEAFWTKELYPWGKNPKVPLGIELFRNAYLFLKQ